MEKFPSSPALSPGLTLDSSGSFTSFVSEFKTWQPPSEEIDPNSFVFAAAEILRFLRDMALEVSTTQSKSLIQNQQQRDKNFYGSPPTTPAVHLRGTPSSHLVHTGAVLCMLDLLPAITFDPSQYPGGIAERKESSSLGSQDSAIAEKSLTEESKEEKNVQLNVAKSDGQRGSLQEGACKVGLGDGVSWIDGLIMKGSSDESPLPKASSIRVSSDKGVHSVDERGSVGSENDDVDGLSMSRPTEGIYSGGGVSVSVEDMERGDRMVWAGELARKKDRVREEKEEETVWETEYCKMSAEEAHKVCIHIYVYIRMYGEESGYVHT